MFLYLIIYIYLLFGIATLKNKTQRGTHERDVRNKFKDALYKCRMRFHA